MSELASAPGKAILAGEHAVVYGEPAIAIPLSSVRARAFGAVTDFPLTIVAEDLARPPAEPVKIGAEAIDPSAPLALMADLTRRHLGADEINGEIRIRSDIPIARGLGSGAAVSAAIGRAIARLRGAFLHEDDLNRLVFEVEKGHHGTPSGIDNAVVVYESPLCFVKGGAPDFIQIAEPLWIVVADSGVASLTRHAVAAVRAQARDAPSRTARLFAEIGSIVREVRAGLARGDTDYLGELMTANHRLLRALDVSSPVLDSLVEAALAAGALGAKLSGGGRGGSIIALATEETATAVKRGLMEAGAKEAFLTIAGEGSRCDDTD